MLVKSDAWLTAATGETSLQPAPFSRRQPEHDRPSDTLPPSQTKVSRYHQAHIINTLVAHTSEV